MLEEYKEICQRAADIIPDWRSMSKNDLCRQYVLNKGDETLQNAYMSAILYKYWNLIGKYYYMSSNCVTPDECYGWLVDSVSCCVNLASWENPDSSIYKDPNGPDKVINRCMKCARLTYYQFINRKKRKDDFGVLSIDELSEMFGSSFPEPADDAQEIHVEQIDIKDYIVEQFEKKNYFVSFLVYFIISSNVFDIVSNSDDKTCAFNMRKICKVMSSLTPEQLYMFSEDICVPYDSVLKAASYVKIIPQSSMKKKIVQTLENLKHSSLIKSLLGG